MKQPQIFQNAMFPAKLKILTFANKNVLFRYFSAGILKNYCYIWNQCPLICLNAKFHARIKILPLELKSVIWEIWAPILKSYCHIWHQHPRTGLIAKFCVKIKIIKFGNKKCLIWGFCGQSLFEVITLEFARNEILTHTVSFGKTSAFSKGSGSTFSEVAGLVPGPFYKACLPKHQMH